MRRRTERTLCAALLAAAAVASGCGQRGPLSLPDSARPIQRVDPNAAPPAPAPASGAPAAPGDSADEEQNGNER